VSVPPASDVVTVDPGEPDPDALERAGALLRAGRLVAFPTETVYGLGADALNRRSIGAVFEGKGRPRTDPLIVHVPSVAAARAVVSAWPDVAGRLADAFWPGPLTLVLPRAAQVPAEVAAGRPTVAVRVPAHPVALGLLRAARVPVAAPSANRFGRVSPTSARHVVEELDGVYDLLIDAGPTPLGVESTVVDVTGEVPMMLRPGGVTLEHLRDVLGEVHHRERSVAEEDRAAGSPGEFLRHYAPSTPLALVEGGGRLVEELRAGLDAAGVRAGALELDRDPAVAARELYGALRRADGSGWSVLLARAVDPRGLGRAVNDRLFRAAHGRVVLDSSAASVARLADLAHG
jgi:L-threonylcarbamoyladenylate synthase